MAPSRHMGDAISEPHGPNKQNKQTKTKIVALFGLIKTAERKGYSLSHQVHTHIEALAHTLFNYDVDPAASVRFSSTLKDTAVRLFRQRRYREADAHYRLAAQFNPTDPTLVSNRATCMYNLAKYQECINICHDCMRRFKSKIDEMPFLFFKLTIRIGRANIALGNFSEAQNAYESLCTMMTAFEDSADRDMQTEQEMRDLRAPFEKHLNATRPFFENNATEFTATTKRPAVEEVAPLRELQLPDLCPHLYKGGKGSCEYHSQGDSSDISYPARTRSMEDSFSEEEDSANESDHLHESSLSNSVSENGSDWEPDGGEERDQKDKDGGPQSLDDKGDIHDKGEGGGSGDDEDKNKPDVFRPYFDPRAMQALAERPHEFIPLIPGHNVPHSTAGQSDSSGPSSSSRTTRASGTSSSSRQNHSCKGKEAVKKPASAPIDWTNVWKEDAAEKQYILSLSDRISPKRSRASSSSHGKSQRENDRAEAGLKRGFLDLRFRAPSENSEGASQHGRSFTKRIERPEHLFVRCYDSDGDDGPLTTGLLKERSEEDATLVVMEKKLPEVKRTNGMDVLTSVISDVLGKSFHVARTIDFTRIFGHHETAAGNGKRRRKSCTANCKTCFARKMWRMRFKSSDYAEAEAYLGRIDSDPRRDPTTFLPGDLWQGTGYYASGYEMAFDVPALVHGVAYICHLQCELYWRGDTVPLLKDIQHSFISSLERNVAGRPNFQFLFMIFFLLRDTVNLFELFPNPSGFRAERSFQFEQTAAKAAKSLFPPPQWTPGAGPHKYNVVIAARSESLIRNVHNWGVVGQVGREEGWIYNILLRDVSHLISKLANKITTPSCHLEPGETFSEAFKKACGERSKDEMYWRCRIVSIIERDRCRQIERAGRTARRGGDLDHSEQLFSSAIGCRPLQPRLLYRRSQIRAAQKRWKDCLNDIRKARGIVESHPQNTTTNSGCPTPQTCLLLDIYTLEADVMFELSEIGADENSIPNIEAAVEGYKKALSLIPEETEQKAELYEKLGMASHRHFTLRNRAPKLSRQKSAKKVDINENSTHYVGDSSAMMDRDKNSEVPQTTEESLELIQKTTSSRPKGKRRKSRKRADKGATPVPKPVQETAPRIESSSEDDDQGGGSLAGNPYAALLEGGTPALSQNSGVENPALSPTRNKKQPTDAGQTVRPVKAGRGKRNVNGGGAAHVDASPQPARRLLTELRCDLCDVSFGGKVDHDSHMRGKRHRIAVKRRTVSAASANGSRVANSESSGQRDIVGTSSAGQGRARSPPAPKGAQMRVAGPNEQEALAEAERAMAILGGEARPCDVVARMNFSKWDIQNVNDYLERRFGGLLALCLPKTDIFELRPGSESRPVLMLINRVRRRAQRRNSLHRPNGRAAMRHGPSMRPRPRAPQNNARFPIDDSDFPALDSHRHEETRQRFSRIVTDMSAALDGFAGQIGSSSKGVGTLDQSPGVAKLQGQDSEACGICMDKPPDVRCMPCKHEWCEGCILNNMKRGRFECPMCMGQVLHLERLAGDLD